MKGQIQVYDLQCNELTSLIHFVQLYIQRSGPRMLVYCVRGQILVSVLSMAVLIILFLLKSFSLLAYIYLSGFL